MAQLGYPTIFCHALEADSSGAITGTVYAWTNPKERRLQPSAN